MKLAQYKARSTALYADIEAVLKKHNFKAGKLRATVTEETGRIKLSIEFSDSDGPAPHALAYTAMAKYHGLDPKWLGKSFKSGTRTFKVEGLKERGAKCVIISEGAKMLVCVPRFVQAAMR